MAGGDEFLSLAGDVRGVGAALMLMGAGTNVYDAFSAVMSSPWSTEKFTENAEAEKMAREYVTHAMVISWGYALAGAWLARSIWPIIGAAGVTGYMYWLYNRALNRARGGSSMNGNGTGAAGPASDTTPAPRAYPWSA
jgi:hypothetical protein